MVSEDSDTYRVVDVNKNTRFISGVNAWYRNQRSRCSIATIDHVKLAARDLIVIIVLADCHLRIHMHDLYLRRTEHHQMWRPSEEQCALCEPGIDLKGVPLEVGRILPPRCMKGML